MAAMSSGSRYTRSTPSMGLALDRAVIASSDIAGQRHREPAVGNLSLLLPLPGWDPDSQVLMEGNHLGVGSSQTLVYPGGAFGQRGEAARRQIEALYRRARSQPTLPGQSAELGSLALR